jgi:hypothetical protein
MGGKQAIAKQMIIIGGCELSLEWNPYSSIEILDYDKKEYYTLPHNCLIPVRGAMAHIY